VIVQKAYKIIEQMAEQEKLDAVLAESAWVSPRVDITDKILKLLDK
jgi:outer membrane protein